MKEQFRIAPTTEFPGFPFAVVYIAHKARVIGYFYTRAEAEAFVREATAKAA